MGLRFKGCVTNFVEIPLFDSSGCQQLVEGLKGVSRADETIAVAGIEALNICHLFDALQRAGKFATNTIDSVSEIAQSVTWHLSSLSTSSREEELPIMIGEKEDGPSACTVGSQAGRSAYGNEASYLHHTGCTQCGIGGRVVCSLRDGFRLGLGEASLTKPLVGLSCNCSCPCVRFR